MRWRSSSTLPHRSAYTEASSSDMSRHVGDLVLNYHAYTSSHDQRWIERKFLPLHDDFGKYVELHAAAGSQSGNHATIEVTWTLICTEVYWI
jgi:hypothetical protein